MMRPRRRSEWGFTLVELMVVIVIIGLAASLVVLAVPESGGSLQAEAERFAARAKAARDNAIVEARAATLEVGPEGYRFARRVGGEWRRDEPIEWADRTAAEASGTGRTRFDTTGLAEPMFVTLRRGERRVSVEIRGDGTVHVRR